MRGRYSYHHYNRAASTSSHLTEATQRWIKRRTEVLSRSNAKVSEKQTISISLGAGLDRLTNQTMAISRGALTVDPIATVARGSLMNG